MPDSLRILMVEDLEPFRQFLRSVLRKVSGLQIVGEVSDRLEAIDRAAELQPDLIVLNIGFPTLNGIEAATEFATSLQNPKYSL
jgi:DNA-binding NarL/FixJ family response regulator